MDQEVGTIYLSITRQLVYTLESLRLLVEPEVFLDGVATRDWMAMHGEYG